jgi:hypothetical protein
MKSQPDTSDRRGGTYLLSYTCLVMTQRRQSKMSDVIAWSRRSPGLLGLSRAATTEVQVCGIPKLSGLGVAPT